MENREDEKPIVESRQTEEPNKSSDPIFRGQPKSDTEWNKTKEEISLEGMSGEAKLGTADPVDNNLEQFPTYCDNDDPSQSDSDMGGESDSRGDDQSAQKYTTENFSNGTPSTSGFSNAENSSQQASEMLRSSPTTGSTFKMRGANGTKKVVQKKLARPGTNALVGRNPVENFVQKLGQCRATVDQGDDQSSQRDTTENFSNGTPSTSGFSNAENSSQQASEMLRSSPTAGSTFKMRGSNGTKKVVQKKLARPGTNALVSRNPVENFVQKLGQCRAIVDQGDDQSAQKDTTENFSNGTPSTSGFSNAENSSQQASEMLRSSPTAGSTFEMSGANGNRQANAGIPIPTSSITLQTLNAAIGKTQVGLYSVHNPLELTELLSQIPADNRVASTFTITQNSGTSEERNRQTNAGIPIPTSSITLESLNAAIGRTQVGLYHVHTPWELADLFSQIPADNRVASAFTITRNSGTSEEGLPESSDTDMSCVVCATRKKTVVFMPCFHLITCTECASKVDICPGCRGPIKKRVNRQVNAGILISTRNITLETPNAAVGRTQVGLYPVHKPWELADLFSQIPADNRVASAFTITRNSGTSEEGLPESSDTDMSCVVCATRKKTVVFMPCFHLITCTECASRVDDCPGCRVPIKIRVRAYYNV